MNMRHLSCCLLFVCACAAAQTRPAPSGAATLARGIFDQHSQEALRRAWSIAMILDACGSSVRDASTLESGGAPEMRTGAECALRRAAQLEETLAPFKGGPSGPASPRRPRPN